MIEFLFPGWLAGVILVLATGPLGSFIIWRRMSSFGDTLSHASLLGLMCGVLFNINPLYINILLMVLLAILISWLERSSFLSLNTILGVIAYSSMSLGLILMNLISNSHNIDISSYLFGDLLTVTLLDLIPLAISSFLILF
ncbi:zinc ABC transporter permease subunit ZnuB, partial [Buchnera aphidicola (Hormaphis cornu)]